MKKTELRNCDLVEIAIKKANYPRYQWDGGDDSVYRSDAEIFSDRRFWEKLIESLKYKNPKLKIDNKQSPNWLKFAILHFKLSITQADTISFWKDLLVL